jgi:hypothetical protein
MSKLEITLKYDDLISALTRLAVALENKQAPVQVSAGESVEKEELPIAPEQIEPPSNEEKPVTIEKVRAALTVKSQAGKKAAFGALFKKYDADKLSTVDPSRYADFLKDVEAL